jgi:hypothetical protein
MAISSGPIPNGSFIFSTFDKMLLIANGPLKPELVDGLHLTGSTGDMRNKQNIAVTKMTIKYDKDFNIMIISLN